MPVWRILSCDSCGVHFNHRFIFIRKFPPLEKGVRGILVFPPATLNRVIPDILNRESICAFPRMDPR